MTAHLAVPAVGYLPRDEGTYPNAVDSIVWIVFARYRVEWRVVSIWLTREAARKAAQKHKQRPTRTVSVFVPGLLHTAVTKLRNAEEG